MGGVEAARLSDACDSAVRFQEQSFRAEFSDGTVAVEVLHHNGDGG
jgi:hypothetical protein